LRIEDIKEHTETPVSPISIEEFIEFLRDTEPEWYKEPGGGLILRPLGSTRGSIVCLRYLQCPV